MDLVSNTTIDVTKLAMDGLMVRQKAISANVANVMTPGYQRKDVSFESQLRDIINQDELKTKIKEQNSIQYTPTTLDTAVGSPSMGLTPQQAQYLQSDAYSSYNPQITDDFASGSDTTGNNVNMEQEVMQMANVGLRYQTLTTLEGKALKLISGAIKGDLS